MDGPDENGQLKTDSAYKDDEWDGKYLKYHDNGKLFKKALLLIKWNLNYREYDELKGEVFFRILEKISRYKKYYEMGW